MGTELAARRPFGNLQCCAVWVAASLTTQRSIPGLFFSLNRRFWLLGAQWTFEQLKRKLSLQLHRRADCRMSLCLLPIRVYCSPSDSFRCNAQMAQQVALPVQWAHVTREPKVVVRWGDFPRSIPLAHTPCLQNLLRKRCRVVVVKIYLVFSNSVL